MIIDLERILFVLSTIVGVAFWIIGLYICNLIKWNWKKHKSNYDNDDCIKKLVKNFKWDLKTRINTPLTNSSALQKVPLIYFLMIGSMTIGSVLLLNSLFSLNDMLILIPLVNKIFLFVLLVGIVLVIFYLFKFVEFLSKTNEDCKEQVNLKLDIDQIKIKILKPITIK
tara:strand:+ start:21 stop:527 length:507 start_codon:yes stop_codon:yes gene_type:complete